RRADAISSRLCEVRHEAGARPPPGSARAPADGGPARRYRARARHRAARRRNRMRGRVARVLRIGLPAGAGISLWPSGASAELSSLGALGKPGIAPLDAPFGIFRRQQGAIADFVDRPGDNRHIGKLALLLALFLIFRGKLVSAID